MFYDTNIIAFSIFLPFLFFLAGVEGGTPDGAQGLLLFRDSGITPHKDWGTISYTRTRDNMR